MVGALIGVLGSALSIWEHEKAHEYLELFFELEEIINEEKNKLPSARNMPRYQSARRRMRNLGQAYSTFVRKQNLPN